MADQLSTLNGLVNAIGGGMVIANTEGKFLHFNQAAERIVGLGAADLPAEQWPVHYGIFVSDAITLYPWEKLPLVRAMRGEEVAETVLFIRNRERPDGVWCAVVAAPLCNESGEEQGGVCVFRDITKHKRAEAQLNVLAAAVAHLGEGVLITDSDLDWPGPRIEFVNAAMCKITGFAADELVGKTPRILQGKRSDRRTLDHIKRELSAGNACRCELVNYRQDGTRYDAELFITSLYNADGRRTNFVSIHRDITERKALQAQILRIAEERQRRIGQELHDDVQQKLTGLGLMAKHVVDGLAAQAKREVRLSESESFSQLQSVAAQVATEIRETNEHIYLLAQGLVPVQVDAEGLRAALDQLASRTNKLYHVTCRFHCEHPVAITDSFVATHLFRIAQEAVQNALKHSQADHIEIHLEKDNGDIVLRVLDNGVGIDDKHVSSAGMGLRIMAYRAGLIGATLKIERAEPRGSSVTCRMPTLA